MEKHLDNLARDRLPDPGEFDEATLGRIRRAIEDGLNNAALRERFQISSKTVERLCRELGIKRPKVYAQQGW